MDPGLPFIPSSYLQQNKAHSYIQTDRQIGRQIERQTDKQKDRQTNRANKWTSFYMIGTSVMKKVVGDAEYQKSN